MMSTNQSLSESEQAALDYLRGNGGSVLVTKIPDKNEKDCMGFIMPGIRVYQKLEKKGLVVFTEEEPIELEDEDGKPFEFTFTPMIELTNE